jgi:hypothetical protein
VTDESGKAGISELAGSKLVNDDVPVFDFAVTTPKQWQQAEAPTTCLKIRAAVGSSSLGRGTREAIIYRFPA